MSEEEKEHKREYDRICKRKQRAKKAQKQQAEAAASKLGLNSGGGDGVVKNSPIDNVDTKDVDEDAG